MMTKPTKKLYEKWPFNFGAIHEQNFAKAKVIIMPFPYELTTSFNKGTKNGPFAILMNSRYLDELLDTHSVVGFEPTDIYTLDEFEFPKSSPQDAMAGIEQAVTEEALKFGKTPIILGGEHGLTLGAVRAARKNFKNISVLQLDAHADLINEYEFTKYSHTCVMRRIRELGVPVTQVGIRNINAETENYIKQNKIKNIFYAPAMPINQIIDSLTDEVYLTLDLDVFDPALMPAVGTPEPGGFSWQEIINLIRQVAKHKKIIAADVVELAPIPGLNAPNFLAAKLVYEIIKASLN